MPIPLVSGLRTFPAGSVSNSARAGRWPVRRPATWVTQGRSSMTSRTINAAGPVAAVSRLIRRRVCGHSVIATRIVVPTSSARLTVIASLGLWLPSGFRLCHRTWQRQRLPLCCVSGWWLVCNYRAVSYAADVAVP